MQAEQQYHRGLNLFPSSNAAQSSIQSHLFRFSYLIINPGVSQPSLENSWALSSVCDLKRIIWCLWVSVAPAFIMLHIPVGKCFLISVASSRETTFGWNSDHRWQCSKTLTVARETHQRWSWPAWFGSPRWPAHPLKILWGCADLCSSCYVVLPNVCYLTAVQREARMSFFFLLQQRGMKRLWCSVRDT